MTQLIGGGLIALLILAAFFLLVDIFLGEDE